MDNYPYNNNYNNNGYQPPVPQPSYQGTPGPQKPKKKRGIGGIIAAAVSGIVVGALVMGLVIAPNLLPNNQVGPTPSAPAASEAPAEASAAPEESPELGGSGIKVTDPSNPVPEIMEVAGKSVVSVQLYNRSYVSGQEPIEKQIGGGSGFVISNDGLIMTNHHVVEGANAIKVITKEGKEYDAEVVGSDPNTEVALLRVNGLDLPALPIGNSDEAKQGELVIAVGNPINDSLNGTVTVGYLSGTDREMELNDTGTKISMLQTDAAINPGNSGGPLLNSKGEVIGITTMKTVFAGVSSSGNAITAEGIGYAVPITKAMEIADIILENGSVPLPAKPGIGFSYQPVSAQDAQMWGVPQGIMIASVVPGSPAEKVGLRQSDVIVSLDGVDLTEGAEVPKFDDRNVGDVIPAVVWRNGQTHNVEFTLADLNELNG